MNSTVHITAPGYRGLAGDLISGPSRGITPQKYCLKIEMRRRLTQEVQTVLLGEMD
jgi:hypothetical protein